MYVQLKESKYAKSHRLEYDQVTNINAVLLERHSGKERNKQMCGSQEYTCTLLDGSTR
jgi:hypothetical protein